jgi:hypothetical protein
MLKARRLISALLVAITLIAIPVVAVQMSTTNVRAVPSPTAEIEFFLTVHPSHGGTGTYTEKKDADGNKICTLTAKPKNGYTFTYWDIKGKYKLIKNDEKSNILSILLLSNCVATPYFTKDGEKEPDTTPIIINDSDTSPKTGDVSIYPTAGENKPDTNISVIIGAGLFAVAAIAIIATGVVVIQTKRRKKNEAKK